MRLLSIAIMGMALGGTAMAGDIGQDQPNRPEEGAGYGFGEDQPQEPGRQGGGEGRQGEGRQGEGGQGEQGRYECAPVDQEVLRATWELHDLAVHMQEVANLAGQNGSNELKQLVADMGQAYGQLASDIEMWAEGQGIQLGQTPPGVFSGQLAQLGNLQGARFDRQFIRLVQQENQRVLDDINALDMAGIDQEFSNQLQAATQLFESYVDKAKQYGQGLQRPGDDDGFDWSDIIPGGDDRDDQGGRDQGGY